jgi:nucleoside-diphosphate-sugar epimerase
MSPTTPPRAAVTGGSGFVGGHIVAKLLSRGYTVSAVVRDLSSPSLTHLRRLALLHPGLLDLAEVLDLTVPSPAYIAALRSCTSLHHVANPIGPASGSLSDEEFVNISVRAAETALSVAHAACVPRVVLTASMATVCGTQTARNPAHIYTEEDWNDDCTSRYSTAKTRAEEAAWAVAKKLDGLELTVINPSLVLGPTLEGQPPRSSNERLYSLASGGWREGGGLQPGAAGVVHVQDVAEAHVVASEREEAAGQRYLATLPDQYTVLEIAGVVRRCFPFLDAPEEYARGVNKDVPRVGRKPSSSNEKLTKLLGRELLSIDRAVVDGVCAMVTQGFLTPM